VRGGFSQLPCGEYRRRRRRRRRWVGGLSLDLVEPPCAESDHELEKPRPIPGVL
jgi:hypothetical protein